MNEPINLYSGVVHDYYEIDIPADFTDPQERFDLAVSEARERTRIYAMPCNWVLLSDDGHTVKVRRDRRRMLSRK